MKPAKYISIAISGLLVLVAFQNCGKGFESMGNGSSGLSSITGFFSAQCLSDLTYDACLFNKNPAVSQVSLDQTGLASTQTFGVRLPSRPDPTILMNENILVLNTDGTELTLPPKGLEALPENESTISSLMAFYWGDKVLRLLKRAPAVMQMTKPILVFAGAPANGYVSEQNLVLIKNSGDGNGAGYDASFITHIMVEATIAQVTGGRIYDLAADTNHRDCGSLEGPVFKLDCCTTVSGCSKAVTAGIADYFTAVVFEEVPAVGDYYANQPGGMNICGVARNPRVNSILKVQEAFDSCKITGRQGQVYNMGALLTSSLFTIRSLVPAADRGKFDTLIATSLINLNPTDTFDIYFQNLKKIDNAQFSRRFSSRIDTETNRRGIIVAPAPAPVN